MMVKSGRSVSKGRPTEATVSTPAFIAIIVAVCVLIGLIGYWIFAPHPTQLPPRQLTAQEQAANQWIKQKALETGGEVSKLSPQDQQKLILMKGDAGPSLLKKFAGK